MGKDREGSNEYQVESILDRKVFSGKVLYLTKWKGFPSSDATWESVKVLKPYRHLIRQFHQKNRPEVQPEHQLSQNPEVNKFEDLPQEPEGQQSPNLKNASLSLKGQRQQESQTPALKDMREEVTVAPKSLRDQKECKQKGQAHKQKKIKTRAQSRKFQHCQKDHSANFSSSEESTSKSMRFLFCQERRGEVEYVVQERDSLRRYKSKELALRCTKELVRCLEKALLRSSSSCVL